MNVQITILWLLTNQSVNLCCVKKNCKPMVKFIISLALHNHLKIYYNYNKILGIFIRVMLMGVFRVIVNKLN